MEETILAGKIYEKIRIDDRVHANLQHCIFCKIVSEQPLGDSRITLNCIDGVKVKQCPYCRAVYILKNPLDGNHDY